MSGIYNGPDGQTLHGDGKPVAICGSARQVQVVCKEQPFFINNNRDVAFQDPTNVILFLNYEFFSGISEQSARDMVRALNLAYKLGYEKDRKEWI